ncbi:MAG: hypothetical protein QOG71_3143 [Pyrinomonadaceae bacterium]|nr:hypothetical protein [Pyrinomonadaceae bacterium]
MDAAIIVAVLSILFTLGGVFWQVRAKRMDDKRAVQLQRLDKQLSDLYGPLYALYESGDRQWRAFLKEFSNCKDPEFLGFFPIENEKEFDPPDREKLRIFRLWTENVFMLTNTRMEEIIINNAELLIGEEMPQPFLNFCVHVSALRSSVAEWNSPNFDQDDWKKHIAIFPHPAGHLYIYIKVSFEILKKEQSLLLSGAKSHINEKELDRQIKNKIDEVTAAWLRNKKKELPHSARKLTSSSEDKEVPQSQAAPNNSFNATPR